MLWLLRRLNREWAAVAGVVLLTLLVSSTSMFSPDHDNYDSARHVMDGFFFYDLIHDHPAHLQQYAFSYFKQYPAVGFIFWPPLFAFVLGLFCLVMGPHVLAARACLLFFGLVFGVSFYKVMRRHFATGLAFAATAAAISVPGMAWSYREVMLELPTLAVMLVAMLSYYRIVDHLGETNRYRRGVVCAVCCAAVIYTKQPAWFLYAALLVDFVVNHRRFLRKPEVLLAAAGTALLAVPLALFMVKFGHDNFAQSVGKNTQVIMAGYESLPRWSVAAWMFYPKTALVMLNPVILALALGALVVAVVRREFLKQNALWFAWLLLTYVTFTFYDNRSERNATFWWPAWVVLAAAFLQLASRRLAPGVARYAPMLLLLPIPFQLATVLRRDHVYLHGQRPAVQALFADGSPGNVLEFSKDEYVLITLLRENDLGRTVHVLRGARLLQGGETLEGMCRRYRVKMVLTEVETGAKGKTASVPDLVDRANFTHASDQQLVSDGTPFTLSVFEYTGPVDAVMADVPLSNRIFKQ